MSRALLRPHWVVNSSFMGSSKKHEKEGFPKQYMTIYRGPSAQGLLFRDAMRAICQETTSFIPNGVVSSSTSTHNQSKRLGRSLENTNDGVMQGCGADS
jgi:hypothetical protein